VEAEPVRSHAFGALFEFDVPSWTFSWRLGRVRGERCILDVAGDQAPKVSVIRGPGPVFPGEIPPLLQLFCAFFRCASCRTVVHLPGVTSAIDVIPLELDSEVGR